MKCSRLRTQIGRFKWGPGAFIAFVLLCNIVLLSAFSHTATALTTVPTKMNFQGRLTDSAGNIKPNGSYNMTFRAYTASSGGSAVWTETRSVFAGNSVQVTNGLFSVKIGDGGTPIPASLFATGSLYLEVEMPTPATATCAGSGCATYSGLDIMSPRSEMATSAYSFNSELLDGLDSSAFTQLTASNTFTGDNLFKTTSATAVRIQDASSVDLFTADTSTMRIGIGLASPTLGRLHVTWVSGDTLPAIYGGSSSGSNNQVGVLGRSGSGAGLQGISGTGFGMQASSTSNIGVLGSSTSSIGVQGRSDTSTSGLFVSTNTAGTNSSTTLVTRASTSQVGDLFQAQDAGSVALFKINADGSVRTKVGTGLDSATAFVIQDAGGNEMLTADSIADRLYIGDTVADGTGVLLVLDTKNNAGDPTGTDGAMYYNSSLAKFRCYENGVWWDCITGGSERRRRMPTESTDFLGNVAAGTSEAIVPWDYAAVSSGTQAAIDGQASHPGILGISSSTTANSGATIRTNVTSYQIAGGEGTEFVFQPRVASNTNTTLRMGFIDTFGSTETNDGVYFEMAPGSMAIVGKTRMNNSPATTTTSSTIATLTVNTWYRAQLSVNSAGTLVTYNIYNDAGTFLGSQTINTNIPTGGGTVTGHGIAVTNSGIVATSLAYFDYMSVWQEGRLLTR